jgi:hypothetical protein
MKIMAKLYDIDAEAMLIFEDAFNSKVDKVVGMDIKDFVKVEEVFEEIREDNDCEKNCKTIATACIKCYSKFKSQQ